VPQIARELWVNMHLFSAWKKTGCELRVDLSLKRVTTAWLEKSRRHKRSHALPDPGTPRGAEYGFDICFQLARQLPQYFQIAVADDGNLNFSDSTFRPSSS
jgi:hypothetical protein